MQFLKGHNMIDLSIIIPCYLKNEELLNLTKSTIHSFREADLPKYELILVDDNSPLYGGYLRDEADVYIKHKENKGFSKSVNDGLNVARGEFVVVANNDIRVAKNFFEVSKEIFSMDKRVYSVHPRMCFYEEALLTGTKDFLQGRERWCQSSFFIQRNGYHRFPEHFKGTGGAYEDWFYWSRVREDEWKTAYTTRTAFQHKDSSTTQLIGEWSKYHEENRELFKKHFKLYPEAYYEELYFDQMKMPWREEFTKL